VKPREIVENAFKLQQSERLPFCPLIGVHSAVILNVNPRIAFTRAEVMAKLQEKITYYYEVDCVFPFMDLTVEAEALGCKITWNNGPSILEHLSLDDVRNIEPEINGKGRIPIFLETVKILSEKLASNYMIGAYVSGPLTLSANLMGVENMLKWIISKREFSRRMIEFSKIVCEKYSILLIESGADTIMILEPVGALISQRHFNEYLLKPLKSLVNTIEKKGVWSILHICGDANHILMSMALSDAHSLSIDEAVKLKNAFLTAKNNSIMGNISTKTILTSFPDHIKNICEEIIREADKTRFIFSSGCEVPPHTPPENIKIMSRVVKYTRVDSNFW